MAEKLEKTEIPNFKPVQINGEDTLMSDCGCLYCAENHLVKEHEDVYYKILGLVMVNWDH